MFGKRSDGVKVKNLDIIEKATPYFMPMRIDAVNYYNQPISCENLDKFILEQKAKNGVHYSYTEILIAAAVRMLYERPKTNRFINNCVIYQRNYISVSMAVKEKLTDDGAEDTLKFYFTGRESLPEVKKIVDDEIAKFTNPSKEDLHKTTKAANFLCKLPNWLFKFALWVAAKMDKHNCLPRKLIDASPFHTSMFVTDLRSIKLDKVFHHLYNFGNTTIFGALGKVQYVPVSDRSGAVTVEKRMELGLSLDERVCDGLYYGKSVRLLMSYLSDPNLLMTALPEPELDQKALKKKQKHDKKIAKNEERKLKRQQRKERLKKTKLVSKKKKGN